MLDLSVILSAALLLLVYLISAVSLKTWKNKPPGPSGLPIVGNLYHLGRTGKPIEVIQEWKEEYGDVVGVHLGQYRLVILNSYKTIKEAFTKPELSGRPMLKPFKILSGGEKRGLTLSEGQAWIEQRRFALKNLRDFGFGKNKSVESCIQEDVMDLMESLKEQEGQAFDPHDKFNTAMIRSLWNIIAGERYTFEDDQLKAVLDGLHSLTSAPAITGPVFFLPWLASLFPKRSGWTAFQAGVWKAVALVGNTIIDHKRTFDPKNARDFIDVYLREMGKTEDPKSSIHIDNGADMHLLVGVANLFAGGSETISNTLLWTLRYLIKYPQVQEKLFEEVQKIIGLNRLPSLEDRDSCPYTLAVMEETFRMSSVVPLGEFHSAMEDITFKGYNIPKGTLIAANLYGVHHDKKLWGDPDVFCPERFLDEDGKTFIGNRVGPVIPFSVGKRACLGEVLARNNYFLYLTSLVQKFKFEPGPGNDREINDEGTLGLFRNAASQFKVLIKEREVN